MANSQMHIYDDGRIHIQTGEMNSYTKRDLNVSDSAADALQAYYDAQISAGNFGRSFADTDTPYVPVEVTVETKEVVTVRGTMEVVVSE